ncbi:YbaK/EbsC family protein [Bacillus sp. DX4.1]|uniref:aminoacyl-tRNA deacylase n=1 Tax=Bacillus sp. DX4.1 TaxID=3055867 RepID=UPI0025A125C7|nr:YbaK/EbsC family protein [Bacillus sp. DX4.1]MDM5186746.1 YbaK/EbsC family protein [Bacillus sp. DX4.1]
MKSYEKKCKKYLDAKNISAEHLTFSQTCHSVEDAAKATNTSPEQFVKNICMMDQNNNFILAVLKGEDRASTTRVGKALNIERPRLATEQEIVKCTGYLAGGVPSFGYDATFLIDPKVMKLDYIFTGGGSPHSLVKIKSEDVLKMNEGQVTRIRK